MRRQDTHGNMHEKLINERKSNMADVRNEVMSLNYWSQTVIFNKCIHKLSRNIQSYFIIIPIRISFNYYLTLKIMSLSQI